MIKTVNRTVLREENKKGIMRNCKMKKITLNEYFDQSKKIKRHKKLSLPELMHEANQFGCECSIEDISKNLWNYYK